MGIQKYRFDRHGETQPNGAVPVYVDWMCGPSLAGVRNCPCSDGSRRTVYVQGECDTFFSQPAAVQIRGKRHKGYITSTDNGLEFRFYDSQVPEVPPEAPINLDCLSSDPEDYFAFWRDNRGRAAARKLFPSRPVGYIAAARALANYASNKGTAMQCRNYGDIESALEYESICERIYSRLPKWAQW